MLTLGRILVTPGVLSSVETHEITESIYRQLKCDWGEVCTEDWKENDKAVELGYRVLSVYESSNGVKFWIITEADRSSTTVLLPNEY